MEATAAKEWRDIIIQLCELSLAHAQDSPPHLWTGRITDSGKLIINRLLLVGEPNTSQILISTWTRCTALSNIIGEVEKNWGWKKKKKKQYPTFHLLEIWLWYLGLFQFSSTLMVEQTYNLKGQMLLGKIKSYIHIQTFGDNYFKCI